MLRYADVDALVRSTRSALQRCLRAVLDGDADAAGEVLETGPARRALRTEAELTLRSRAWVPAPQVQEELRFVAAVGHVDALLDDLARRVADPHGPRALPPSEALDVAALLDAGDRQLAQVLALEPGGGRRARGAATALFTVADHGSARSSPTVRCCGDLAVELLRVSRLAAAVG